MATKFGHFVVFFLPSDLFSANCRQIFVQSPLARSVEDTIATQALQDQLFDVKVNNWSKLTVKILSVSFDVEIFNISVGLTSNGRVFNSLSS